jgi:hypothetical protein
MAAPIARARLAAGAAIFATYLGVSFGVGNLYPFSIYDMYASDPGARASRLVVRDAAGLREISRFSGFACDEPVRAAFERCKAQHVVNTIGYVVDEHLRALETAPASGDAREPVDVVMKVWGLDERSVVSEAECRLSRCEASRR